MNNDVICQIVAGELEAEIVHRDEQLITFLDHRPVFKGHVLIAPVQHIDSLLTLPQELMQPILELGQLVSRAMINSLGAKGSFSAINTVVSQSIPHLHLHVVPRTKGDGLRGFFWPRTRYAAGEAAQYAAKLREGLGRVS